MKFSNSCASIIKFISVITLTLAAAACGSQTRQEMGAAAPSKSGQSAGASDAKTGSTARFSVMNEKLYIISGGGIDVFDISVAANPTKSGFTGVALDIETLFNDGKHLFVGSESALHIYAVTNPDRPVKIGFHRHARACDPVVTSGDVAYVTLRNDNPRCGGTRNVLKVVDIEDRSFPFEIASIPMHAPKGLGIADKRLFICDGDHGMVEFDISNPHSPLELSGVRDEKCFDVIPLEKTLITTGQDGISQYDIEQGKLIRLSRIEVEKAQ
ncbi:MAG: hypothetical protein EBR09_15185 [Proteobacteria bacterium]|nr:hypothetical protein [Pseudomonadota bacterium]